MGANPTQRVWKNNLLTETECYETLQQHHIDTHIITFTLFTVKLNNKLQQRRKCVCVCNLNALSFFYLLLREKLAIPILLKVLLLSWEILVS